MDVSSLALQGAVAYVPVDGPRRRAGGPSASPRGKICGFSAASRRRLSLFLRKLRWRGVRGVLFVTLTYARGPDLRTAKRDLNRFLVWLRAHYPQASYVWKLEFQRRGVPHYHLIIAWPNQRGRIPWIPKEQLAAIWKNGFVDIRFVPVGPRLLSYVVKYVLKPADGDPGVSQGAVVAGGRLDLNCISQGVGFVGRFWGASRNWVFAPLVVASSLPRAQYEQLCRVLQEFFVHLSAVDVVWGGIYQVSLPFFAS